MRLNRTPNPLDRDARNGENDNWDIIEGETRRLNDTISDLVLESGGDSNLEVVQARGGKPVLNDRLNSIDTQLAERVTKKELNNKLSAKRDKAQLVDLDEMTPRTLSAIEGGEGTEFKLLSIPRPRSVTPLETTFIERSKNIFNKNDIVVGHALSHNSGNESPSAYNSYFKFTRVEPNTTYIKNWDRPSQVLYYTAEREFISGEASQLFTTPADCYYIQGNLPGKTGDGLQIEIGNIVTPFEEPYIKVRNAKIEEKTVSPNVTTFIEDSPNLLNPKHFIKNKVVTPSTGQLADSSFNSCFHMIPIKGAGTYIKNWDRPSQVVYYDAHGDRIGSVSEKSFDVDDLVKYVTLNIPGAVADGFQLQKGEASTPYKPYGYDFNKPILESDVLKVRFDINEQTSKLERLDGIESLDELDELYPFNSIKLCNVKKTDWGATRITYADEEDFTRDGSNGEVMVEIPKVYFKRYRKRSFEYLEMSGKPKEGFWLDPAFIENGKELDAIYVSAYDGSVIDGKLRSISGVMASGDYSITELRNLAKANGKGFGLLDARTVFLLQRLFMLYFSDRNSQDVLGSGLVSFTWQSSSSTLARVTAAQTNTIRIDHTQTNHQIRGFVEGMNVAVVEDGSTYQIDNPRKITAIQQVDSTFTDITFTGDPINLTADISRIYSLQQDSGLTDNIEHHTGMANEFDGQDGHEAIKFFHIENLWGNIWPLLDGFVASDLVSYVGENMDDYTSDITKVKDKYVPLSYKLPLQDTNNQNAAEETFAYVKSLTYEKQHPAYMPPYVLGGGSSPTTMFCDPFYSYASGDRIAAFGGGIDHMFRAGLFTMRAWYRFNSKNAILCGARTIFKPI